MAAIINANIDALSALTVKYSMCILCQTKQKSKKGEKLINPYNLKNKQQSIEDSYSSVVANLKVFDERKKLPSYLSSLLKIENLAEIWKNERASWHKSCRLKYGKSKTKKLTISPNSAIQLSDVSSTSANESNLQNRPNRENSNDKSKCFFCDQVDDDKNLHLVSTFNRSQKIQNAASYLKDCNLTAKLSGCDLIAVEAKYHLSCSSALDNAYRNALRKASKSAENGKSLFETVAFTELCDYIKHTLLQNEKLILPLTELHVLVSTRMEELGSPYEVNRTRLKEKLIENFPNLNATKCGKNIVFFRNAFDYSRDCEEHDKEEEILLKAAKIVRKNLFEKITTIGDENQKKSVPQKLVTLIGMILQGRKENTDDETSQAALTIAQLIKFNSSKGYSNTNVNRHSLEQETPLVRYLANVLHHDFRSKWLINTFFRLGLCISYKRTLQISTALGNVASETFEKSGVVCPTNMPKNQFVTVAIDNIDHNMSSTTSVGSFHGTAITIHTHPDSQEESNLGKIDFSNINFVRKGLNIKPLPASYTLVEPIAETVQKSIKTQQFAHNLMTKPSTFETALHNESDWVNFVESALKLDSFKDVNVNWSSFHANLESKKDKYPCSIALLPLFQESADTLPMIYHGLKICKQITNHLNGGQDPVIAGDEPLFALIKELQWMYPELFGNIVPIMGSLHHEMAILRCIGQWLMGSEWDIAITAAGIASEGISQSFLSGTHVTKCRHAHQVTVAVLHILRRRAFLKKGIQDTSQNFSDWVETQKNEFPNFNYWNTALCLQQTLLLFVRSIREGNLDLYVSTLEETMPWYFALDHHKYARWTSVHIKDMKELKVKHPDVYLEFVKGKFVVNKTKTPFSSIGIDHAHEQQNDIIKGAGGAIGLTDNPEALLRWMVAGPEVSRLIHLFESQCTSKVDVANKHHLQSTSEQERFIKHTIALLDQFENYGNPFENNSPYLETLISKFQFDENAKTTAKNAYQMGKAQYTKFVEDRLESNTSNFYEPIHLNKLRIFKEKPPPKTSKLAVKNKLLKNDCQLFSRLYIAATHRSVDLDEFFSHENQPFPPSLSNNGHMRFGAKGKIVDILMESCDDEDIRPPKNCTSYHCDGAVAVRFVNTNGVKTFREYSLKFQEYIGLFTKSHQRVDVVWDIYTENSIKRGAREERGKGRVQKVDASMNIPKKWADFLRTDKNKTQLFHLLAKDIVEMNLNDCLVVTTYDENVLSSDTFDCSRISPCNHEESDTRLFVHIKDAIHAGHTKIVIRTVDSDIVVLAVAFAAQLEIEEIEELWIAYGTKSKYKHIPAHIIVENLGKLKSRALPFFHSLTGCDTVSWFNGRGKQTAWDIWDVLGEDLTIAFLKIKDENWEDIESSKYFKIIEKFVGMLYDCNYSPNTHATLDTLRRYLFTQRDRVNLDNLPPTNAAFIEHLKRAVFQGSIIWGSFDKTLSLPNPTLWGWELSDTSFVPHWTSLPELSKASNNLIKCSCKDGVCQENRCGCKKEKIKCTSFCRCKGQCK